MKTKKLETMLLGACMILSACGQNQTEGQKKTESTVVSQNSSQEEAGKQNSSQEEAGKKKYWEMFHEVNDSSELPDWDGKKLEINVWVSGGTEATFLEWKKDSIVLKEIERVTGVTVNVDACFGNGGSSIDAKLPMVIASNNFPTIISGWDVRSQMRELFDEGYLLDLTPYYENGTFAETEYWLPKEEFENSVYSNLRTEDGKYFLYPEYVNEPYLDSNYTPEELDVEYFRKYAVSPASYNIGQIYVRDDVLKRIYPAAKTKKELEQMYIDKGSFTKEEIYEFGFKTEKDFLKLLDDITVAIKEGGFTGIDGRPMETTYGPNTDTDNWGWMVFLPRKVSNMCNTSTYFDWMNKDPDKPLIEWSFASQRYKDWMLLLNSLVKRDIISQNSLVDNAATFKEKINNGHYALTYSNQVLDTANDASEEWDYRPVWFETEIDPDHYVLTGARLGRELGIFKKAIPEEQIEQLLYYFEYCRSAVAQKCAFWGPKSAGLFTEDDSGKRKYVSKELEDRMLYKVDNGANKYGLNDGLVYVMPIVSPASPLFTPGYMYAAEKERTKNGFSTYYNPGRLEGKSLYDISLKVNKRAVIYQLGINIEGIKEFWGARAGFENQMKKVMVAADDADFEKQYQELLNYATDNGLTDETLKEYTELFVSVNEEQLKQAGIIK